MLGAQRKGGGCFQPPPRDRLSSSLSRLLQAAERQVSRELGDEGRTAPGRAGTARIDRGHIARARGARIAGEGVAITLVHVRVRVAQIESEHLPSEADADVPGIVLFEVDPAEEAGDAVEGVAGAEPLAAELTRHVPAD